ncbi:hypothetical protein DRQ09_02475 [candidate division KSB1 bacterium]|nr:MAG: hypothetical protein DRQ09_02475 [candidate division KSB1 bacterium]
MGIDPREVILDSQGTLIVPFKVKQSGGVPTLKQSDIGKPVALTGDIEAGPGEDGDIFLGELMSVSSDGLIAGIKIRGIMKDVPYSGTTPEKGYGVQMSGNFTVDKNIDTGKGRGFVIKIDTNSSTCDLIL